jgi:hypothetical protein
MQKDDVMWPSNLTRAIELENCDVRDPHIVAKSLPTSLRPRSRRPRHPSLETYDGIRSKPLTSELLLTAA